MGHIMRRRVLFLLFVAPVAGCAPATLQASHVPNPVLLGPVDRVGGHSAAETATTTLGRVDAEVNDFVSVDTDQKRFGNTVVVTQKTTASHSGSGVLTNAVLLGTEGRADRDVRVDDVPMGAWAMIAGGSAMAERWVGLRGRVVEVRRDR
jgi:hypothetical protein